MWGLERQPLHLMVTGSWWLRHVAQRRSAARLIGREWLSSLLLSAFVRRGAGSGCGPSFVQVLDVPYGCRCHSWLLTTARACEMVSEGRGGSLSACVCSCLPSRSRRVKSRRSGALRFSLWLLSLQATSGRAVSKFGFVESFPVLQTTYYGPAGLRSRPPPPALTGAAVEGATRARRPY